MNERDFFEIPFNPADIDELLQGKPAPEMCNFRSTSFKSLGLYKDKLSDKELIDLMLKETKYCPNSLVKKTAWYSESIVISAVDLPSVRLGFDTIFLNLNYRLFWKP